MDGRDVDRGVRWIRRGPPISAGFEIPRRAAGVAGWSMEQQRCLKAGDTDKAWECFHSRLVYTVATLSRRLISENDPNLKSFTETCSKDFMDFAGRRPAHSPALPRLAARAARCTPQQVCAPVDLRPLVRKLAKINQTRFHQIKSIRWDASPNHLSLYYESLCDLHTKL